MGSITTKEEMEAEIERQHGVTSSFMSGRRKRLQEIDASTKVGHLLIELRNVGFVELQGKDIGDIYSKLDGWLGRTWGARRLLQDIRPYAQGEVRLFLTRFPDGLFHTR